MTRMSDTNGSPSTSGWNAYWQGAASSENNVVGGFSHPGFATFWNTAVSEFVAMRDDSSPRVLDIGTGSGAVLEAIARVKTATMENVSCSDISAAAIDVVSKRFPRATGIVADAKSIPSDSGQYDLITSQFGIEYAGPSAIDEAVRLLAPGGSLLFLMHIRPGNLYSECTAAVDALQRTRNSNFIELSRDLFEKGFDAVRGKDRAPYEAAAKAMNPAIKKVEAVLTEYGEHVAGDSIIALYSTVQDMHSRIQNYNPDEVFAWLDLMKNELPEHEVRMSSMREASIDADEFRQTCERLTSLGLTIDRAQPSQIQGEELPIAWILQATLPKTI